MEINIPGLKELAAAVLALADVVEKSKVKGETSHSALAIKWEHKEQKVSAEDIRAKFIELNNNGRLNDVKKLLKKFGTKKLSEVTEDKYEELLKETEAVIKAEDVL